jgi:bla regulator protein blaR1
MKRIFAVTILTIFAALRAQSQTATFEVASIKPSAPAGGGMQIGVSPGGTFNAKNVTLKVLIEQAYDVRDFQIAGGPGWVDTEVYDIIAKGDGTGPSEDDMRKMTDTQRDLFKEQLVVKIRALLADRFLLKVHRETKELPVYALAIAKNGTKIQSAADEDVTRTSLTTRRGDGGKTEVTGTRVPVASLVKTLSSQVGRPVLDQTGLAGNYNFKFSFAPDLGQPATETDGPSIFTALQEQLGLRLEAQKGPVEVLVIDSAQKASEN